MAITMKKIADLAGVSVGTVDRALKNKGRVNPEVARRIRNIAESLGYRTNSIAKSLAIRNKNLKIGIILHVHGNLFFDEISKGIQAAADEIVDYGISVIVKKGADFSEESQLHLIDEILEEGANALAIVPINGRPIIERLNALHRSGFPIVYLVSDIPGGECLSYVGCDYVKAGRMAAGLVRLLAEPGMHDVGFITPPLNMLGHNLRFQSFKQDIENSPNLRLSTLLETPNNDIQAYNATKKLFENGPGVDFLILGSGAVYGCYSALEELGLLGKLKVISFDVSPVIRQGLLERKICAAIAQNPQQQGYRAVKTLFEFLTSSQTPPERNLFVPSEIVIRESLIESTDQTSPEKSISAPAWTDGSGVLCQHFTAE